MTQADPDWLSAGGLTDFLVWKAWQTSDVLVEVF